MGHIPVFYVDPYAGVIDRDFSVLLQYH